MIRFQNAMPTVVQAAKESAITDISIVAGASLKQLLETKHLYQKVCIQAEQIISRARKSTHDACLIFDRGMEPILAGPHFSLSNELLRLAARDDSVETHLTLIVANVKLFCGRCESREAFQPVWYRDLGNELGRLRVEGIQRPSLPATFQLFFFVYLCQVCPPAQAVPEGFMVRRNGWDLFLEGRSPMERVPVESFIPKEEREFFRDALIARNSGKTLAGLFYLRTFVEQFARRKVNQSGRLSGDELMSKYADTIPMPQRDQMPSLRELYEKLSEALHSAKEDSSLFEEAKTEIERHFDFRRLFRIP
jgi:hypothetical protein